MQFLDDLILGPNTPRHSDNVQFPSKIYKKKLQKVAVSDNWWEFWSKFLVKNNVTKYEVYKNLKNIKHDLRIAIWDKLINISILINKINLDINKDFIDRDSILMKCVISRFKNRDEEEIFYILRDVVNTFSSIDNYVLLTDFMYLIVNLPNASLEQIERILMGLFLYEEFRNLFQINFCTPIYAHKEGSSSTDRTSECKNDKNLPNYIKKFEDMIYRSTKDLYYSIDLLLTTDSNYYSILDNKHTSPDKKENIIKTTCRKVETYFDFLIVQNENIKAQEAIKNDLLNVVKENEELKKKIDELKKKTE
ncbi:hypothetical protein AAJ76_2200023967 [Vairimorpha ceranae]|uniref:Uncharacterized protein n=1 Tax=Vairimorpha ceranae TaxID=40302 RepID=A0A0F9YS80_9MICR|nr:hypothetical protein AAJ76_2200023967 [Vairimorpha ceranae]KAF5140595.1 hypothetical protein G9O61_00g014000 [Vairimorpha ceranae]KKO75402.1 hypothetical protein AAJ76_2200023967 [Vairimorpha ceranae]